MNIYHLHNHFLTRYSQLCERDRICCFSLFKSHTWQGYLVQTRSLMNDYWMCKKIYLVNILQFPLPRTKMSLTLRTVGFTYTYKNCLTPTFPWYNTRKGQIYPIPMTPPKVYCRQAIINTGEQYKKIQQYWHLTNNFKLVIKYKKVGVMSYGIKHCRNWQAVIYYIRISTFQIYHLKVQQLDWCTNLWNESRANT